MTALVLRHATSVDTADLERLAVLDSQEPLEGDVLLVAAGGELRAALSLDDHRVVADPFWPSAELVQLLRAASGERRRRRWHRPQRVTRPALA